MIARVSDIQQPVGPEGKSPDAVEFAVGGTGSAPGRNDLSVGIQLRDPLADAPLADIEEPVRVLDGVADVPKLARVVANFAAELLDLCAVGLVDADAMVVRIAND